MTDRTFSGLVTMLSQMRTQAETETGIRLYDIDYVILWAREIMAEPPVHKWKRLSDGPPPLWHMHLFSGPPETLGRVFSRAMRDTMAGVLTEDGEVKATASAPGIPVAAFTHYCEIPPFDGDTRPAPGGSPAQEEKTMPDADAEVKEDAAEGAQTDEGDAGDDTKEGDEG